ncbi:hypothetical protein [Catenulispora rubra]|uniref:hypothetical protein n=1 Tax=Catenulispora rubra TaxID=280293 RepID=UPI0018925840|nr:hypothetical protein [Catenulispora rubra]
MRQSALEDPRVVHQRVDQAERDPLEEDLVKRLADMRVERDELVVAERVVQRISQQGFGEYLSLAPPSEAQVGGRSVLLIPARAAGVGEDAGRYA